MSNVILPDTLPPPGKRKRRKNSIVELTIEVEGSNIWVGALKAQFLTKKIQIIGFDSI